MFVDLCRGVNAFAINDIQYYSVYLNQGNLMNGWRKYMAFVELYIVLLYVKNSKGHAPPLLSIHQMSLNIVYVMLLLLMPQERSRVKDISKRSRLFVGHTVD